MSTEKEIFEWMRFSLDISAVLADIEAGKLRPKATDIDEEFFSEYARKVLCLNKEEGANQTRFGLLVGVNAKQALALPEEVLDRPILFMHVGNGHGILKLDDDEKAGHVLADGNHRVARAYFDGRTTPMKAWVLSAAQSRRYYL